MGGLEPPQFIQPADFKSAASTIPPHPQNSYMYILILISSFVNFLIKIDKTRY